MCVSGDWRSLTLREGALGKPSVWRLLATPHAQKQDTTVDTSRHTVTRSHSLTHTHTYTHTQSHTHTRTHALTHTHTLTSLSHLSLSLSLSHSISHTHSHHAPTHPLTSHLSPLTSHLSPLTSHLSLSLSLSRAVLLSFPRASLFSLSVLRFTFTCDKQHEMASHGDRLFARAEEVADCAQGGHCGGRSWTASGRTWFLSMASLHRPRIRPTSRRISLLQLATLLNHKFHSEGSAGNLANVLSGKKRRTKAKRRQAPRDEVFEPRVEFGAGEMNSCDGSRHGMVPLVLENSVQGVACFPSFPTNAEIPVPGEMTSKGASELSRNDQS